MLVQLSQDFLVSAAPVLGYVPSTRVGAGLQQLGKILVTGAGNTGFSKSVLGNHSVQSAGVEDLEPIGVHVHLYLSAPCLWRVVTVHESVGDGFAHCDGRIIWQILSEYPIDHATNPGIPLYCVDTVMNECRDRANKALVVEKTLVV